MHSSIVQCGQLATTHLWCILLWRAERKQQRTISCIIEGKPNYVNFSIDYLIRTMCLLSRVLHTHDHSYIIQKVVKYSKK